MSTVLCSRMCRWFCSICDIDWYIQYNGALACGPRFSRCCRIVGVDNYTPVALLQLSVNCPDYAIRSCHVSKRHVIRWLSSCADVKFRHYFRISDSSSSPVSTTSHLHHCCGIALHTIYCRTIKKKNLSRWPSFIYLKWVDCSDDAICRRRCIVTSYETLTTAHNHLLFSTSRDSSLFIWLKQFRRRC